jgi:hypothetical protein
MNNASVRTALPLWAWFTVLLLVVIFIGATYSFADRMHSHKYSNGDNLRIQRLTPNAKPRSILVMGSSLTRNAFYFDHKMDAVLRANGLQNNFVRVSASAARKSSFEGALPVILKSNPELVILEFEMLFMNRGRSTGIAVNTSQNIALIYSGLKNIFFGTSYPDPSRFKANHGIGKHCNKVNQSKQKFPQVSDLPHQNYKIYSDWLSPAWTDFIDGINQRGGKVVIVELGRSSYASKGFSIEFLAHYQHTVDTLKKKRTVSLWRYPGPFPLENYCDLAHLNEQGQAKFMVWLMSRIRAEYND